MYCRVASLVVAVLLVSAVPAGAATPDEAIGLPQEFDPDSVSLTASVHEDGNATWTFTYRMRLETDNETAAFETLQADVENNTTEYTSRFRQRIAATVSTAENATGREMRVADVGVSTRVNPLNEEEIGVVTYSFTWTSFAEVDGERIVAGDALEGFYLDDETSLRVSWPERYGLVEADPNAERPNANAVEWVGPREFSSGQPRVVVAPNADSENPGDSPSSTTGGPGSAATGLLVPAVAGALAAVLVVAAAGWYLRDYRDGGLGDGGDGGGESEVAGSDDPGDASGPDGRAATGTAAGGGEEEPPEELLSNEERVKKFLRKEGGRAKQQAVVDAMDWTEAKTSQVVKQMREDGDVESFRIGRENVLKLPDAEGGEDEA